MPSPRGAAEDPYVMNAHKVCEKPSKAQNSAGPIMATEVKGQSYKGQSLTVPFDMLRTERPRRVW